MIQSSTCKFLSEAHSESCVCCQLESISVFCCYRDVILRNEEAGEVGESGGGGWVGWGGEEALFVSLSGVVTSSHKDVC